MGSSGGAGKDTVANYIKDNLFNGRAVKHALGEPIHELAEQFAGDKVQRHHLQDLGESIRSIFGHEAWINLLDEKYGGIDVPLIIPDIRKLLEYSHYCIEKEFKPLYVYTDPEIAKKRLKDRDGGYNEEDLGKNIERQMDFLQDYGRKQFPKRFVTQLNARYPFGEIYVIDNSGSLQDTYRQLNEWWELIHE